MNLRVGHGVDVHVFAKGRPLILGGIEIPHQSGLDGHSDADVLLHAIMDSILGAAGASDIGHLFPNTDPKWKGASSVDLLNKTWEVVSKEGWKIMNIDCTLLAEEPKISPYIPAMKRVISQVLKIESSQVGIKATTTEKLGAIGRREGIAAFSVALLSRD